MTNSKDWLWLPHAAHFILGDHCRFHLATYLGNGIIVSTIGEYWPDETVRHIHAKSHDAEWYIANIGLRGDAWDNAYMKRFGYEDIGFERKYETMVFNAKKANPAVTGGCCKYVIDSGHSYDYRGYNDAQEAYDGHLELCKSYANNGINDLVQ